MSETQATSVNSQSVEIQGLRDTISRGRLVLVLAGIMLSMLLAALDQTIVGTAMPHVIAELNGLDHYAWVFTAYMLASTVMVPIYGKLSDIYGRRPFFLIGMALFLAGSALSGTSQDMTQLIAFRGLQGLGAGAMMPIIQAIIGDIFPPAERGKWQGLMMAVFGLATIVGPTAGGWITDNWGWRWVFYVNMPVGFLALTVAGFALPGQIRRTDHSIDYLGAATLVAGAVPLLLAFSWAGTQYEWASAQIIGLMAFSAAMLATFFVVETRAAEPIISPSLFQNRIFSVSVIASFLVSVGMFGAIMYIPLFLQAVVGSSATNSGAVLTPMMLGFMVSSIVGGQIMARTGRYKLLAIGGFAVGTVGMILLSRMDATATEALVIRNMIVTGLGIGVMMSLFTIVVQNAFPFQQLGQVTASLQFFRSIGGTIGVAILGSVMTNGFRNALQANMPRALSQAMPADRLEQIQNPQVLMAPDTLSRLQDSFAAFGPQGQALYAQFVEALKDSLATGVTQIFVISAVVMVLGLISTLFLKEIPLRKGARRSPTVEPDRDRDLPARPEPARGAAETAPQLVQVATVLRRDRSSTP